MKRLADQTLYEILEVPSDAPEAALKAAIERAREIFGPGSLAMYSLMSPDEASLMNRRIEEAWTTLLDPEARARYDARLGSGQAPTASHAATWTLPPVIPARAEPASTTPAPGEHGGRAEATATSGPAPLAGTPPPSSRVPLQLVTPRPTPPPAAPRPEPVAPPPPMPVRAPIRLDRPVSIPQAAAMTPLPSAAQAEPPPPPDIGEDTVWTGEMLRRVREARGIPVQIVAERTKVTRHHLENIEAERFALLPAPVYLRGIVVALARELRLDGQKVARSYLERVTAALSPPPPPPGPKR